MFLSRSSWIRWTGKGLEFTGKVGHTEGLDQWAAGPGAETVAAVASQLSAFGLGAKENRAKDRIAESLADVFKGSESLATALDNFAAAYPTRFAALADADWDHLPRAGHEADLRVLPVFYVNAQERRRWSERFGNASEWAPVAGGPATVEFFLNETVKQATAAFSDVAPESPDKEKQIDKPYQAGEKWVVGFDPQYAWTLDEPGHFYLLASAGTRTGAKGKDAKEARQQATAALLATKDWLGVLEADLRASIAKRLQER